VPRNTVVEFIEPATFQASADGIGGYSANSTIFVSVN
jgi:hypothetical protein